MTDFFITSETTFDVGHEELTLLNDIEDELNGQAADFALARFDRLSFIFLIMNPEVAPPFPGGVIVRWSRRELDMKIPVDFALWKETRRARRAAMVLSKALDYLAGFVPSKVKLDEFASISAFLTSARLPE